MRGFSVEDALAKIERGREHGQSLQREVEAWLNSEPYAFGLTANLQRTRWHVFVRHFRPPDRKRWGLIAGDALHNVRASLDHLLVGVANQHLGSRLRLDAGLAQRIQFPIAKDLQAFKSARGRFEEAIPPRVWEVIEAEQPYNREDRQCAARFRLLHEFDLTDKHREVNVLTMWTPRVKQTGWLRMPCGGRIEWTMDAEFFEGRADPTSGARIIEIEVPSDAEVHVDPSIQLNCEASIAGHRGISAADLIELLAVDARRIVASISGQVR